MYQDTNYNNPIYSAHSLVDGGYIKVPITVLTAFEEDRLYMLEDSVLELISEQSKKVYSKIPNAFFKNLTISLLVEQYDVTDDFLKNQDPATLAFTFKDYADTLTLRTYIGANVKEVIRKSTRIVDGESYNFKEVEYLLSEWDSVF